jgi:hypothetical protein
MITKKSSTALAAFAGCTSLIPHDVWRIIARSALGAPITEAESTLADYWIEEMYAACGYAVVSAATAREIERIEKLNYNVPLSELEAVLYSIHSGVFGEYHPCVKELA